MPDRIQRKEFISLLAKRRKTTEATAEAWLDAVLEILYETFKNGQSVTITGFCGFYVRPERESWVFKFNPGQKLRALFGWSSTYKGKL